MAPVGVRTAASAGRTGRRTPAPAARREHPQDVARPQRDRALVGQRARRASSPPGQEPVLPHGAGPAAGEAPRLRDPPLGDQREGRVGRAPGGRARCPRRPAPSPHPRSPAGAGSAGPASGTPARRPRPACSGCWSCRCGRRTCPADPRRGRGGRPDRRRPSRSRPSRRRRGAALFIVPCEAAPRRSGTAPARAARHTSATRWLTSTLPAPTAAGGRAATTVPAGATTSTARRPPPLAGTVGSRAQRSGEDRGADGDRLHRVDVAPPLRVGAGEVEGDGVAGRCARPRRWWSAAAARAPSRRSRARRWRSTRRRAARPGRRACGARRRRGPRRAARRPARPGGPRPTTLAPTWASMSPRRSSGVREEATRISRTSGVKRTGGIRRPSCWISVASAGSEPGAAPPRSAWWARLAAHPTRRPSSVWQGATRVTSLRWVPPAKGSLTMTCTPGSGCRARPRRWPHAPMPASSPGAPGCARPAPAGSPRRVNRAAEQSARSLMLGLNAARRSTAPISSATPVSRAISTARPAGSRASLAHGSTLVRSRAPSGPGSARHPGATNTVQSSSARTCGPDRTLAVGSREGGGGEAGRAPGRRPQGDHLDRPRRVGRSRCAARARRGRPPPTGPAARGTGRRSGSPARPTTSAVPAAQVGHRLLAQGREGRVEPGVVDAPGPGPHPVALVGGAEDADRGEHPGPGRHDHRRHAQGVGQAAGVERPGPAEGDQGQPPGIDAPGHGHRPDGLLHGRLHDRDDAVGSDAGPVEGPAWRRRGRPDRGRGARRRAARRPATRSASVTVGSAPPRP